MKAMAKTPLRAFEYDLLFGLMTEEERYAILKTHNESKQRTYQEKHGRDASPVRKVRCRSSLEKRMYAFEVKGPYTFQKIKEIAIRCATFRTRQIQDSLNKTIHLFPAEELAKVFDAKKHCSSREYRLWLRGLDVINPINRYGRLSDEQLRALATTPLENWNLDFDFAKMNKEERLAILKVHNDFKARLYAEKVKKKSL